MSRGHGIIQKTAERQGMDYQMEWNGRMMPRQEGSSGACWLSRRKIDKVMDNAGVKFAFPQQTDPVGYSADGLLLCPRGNLCP